MKKQKQSLSALLEQAILKRRISSIYAGQVKRANNESMPGPDYSRDDLANFVACFMGGDRCPYTGKRLTAKSFTIDHAIPIVRGGSFSIANLVLMHKSANLEKASLTLEEYETFLDWLIASGISDYAQRDIRRRMRVGGAFSHRTNKTAEAA